LGEETAAATVESLHEVEPGLSEYDLEAITAQNLLRRGILPSVYLFAVDDRIMKYKHAVARGARLKRYGMLNLCSRKWGLAISITRFVHFGDMTAELSGRFKSAAQVNAALLDATRTGATSAELFRVAKAAYAAEGFPGEERFHHQGGVAQSVVTCANRAGLEVGDTIYEGIAAAEAVLSADERELGVCVVDIGSSTTELAVFFEGSIAHTAVLPIGGDHFTNDLAVG